MPDSLYLEAQELADSSHVHVCKTLAAILLTNIVIGCVGCLAMPQHDERVQITMTKISNDTGLYAEPVWFQNHLVVVFETGEKVNAYSDRLWRLEPDGSAMTPILLPEYPGCHLHAFTAPTRLSDGRLGYASVCGNKQTLERSYYLMAYDFDTGNVSSLRDRPLPYPGLGPGGYAWAPDLTRGIAAHGWMASSSLYWYTHNSWSPFWVDLPQTSFGRWSPDGRTVAFIGSNQRNSDARTQRGVLHHLYSMPVQGGKTSTLTEGFMYPQGLDWSPNGKWFILSASFGVLGSQQGLWLVDATTGEHHLVVEGCYSDPSWSLDSSKVVVAGCPSFVDTVASDLYVLDIDSFGRNLRPNLSFLSPESITCSSGRLRIIPAFSINASTR